MTRVQCDHCLQVYPIIPEEVSVELYVHSPFSVLHTKCTYCAEENTFRMPTAIASWLAWAGVEAHHGIDELEIFHYRQALDDDQAIQDELERLRETD